MPAIRRSALATAAVTAVIALSATACGPNQPGTDAKPSASAVQADQSAPKPPSAQDLQKWKQGDWKKWDHWAHQAADFINPVIKNLWKPSRMSQAKDSPNEVPTSIGQDQGVSDPAPAPKAAQPVLTPYHNNAAPVGKVFFDTPQGSFVCSGTVVDDPAHPGKSNLVWTAGHCVHAGAKGGWYRNIAFVPSYNDQALPASQINSAPQNEVAPYGVWWADWAQSSSQWISTGSETGGYGSPYDFAVLHVKPENPNGKSLQETVGAALPVWFNAPAVNQFSSLGAWGYPAAPPFDGQKMFDCQGKPGRLSLDPSMPTEYRLGCTMTGGSSGGGWFAKMPNGQMALVSNTSIGPADNTWLAGPHLGPEAQGVYQAISQKFANQ